MLSRSQGCKTGGTRDQSAKIGAREISGPEIGAIHTRAPKIGAIYISYQPPAGPPATIQTRVQSAPRARLSEALRRWSTNHRGSSDKSTHTHAGDTPRSPAAVPSAIHKALHPCHARRRAPCAPVGALAVLHQPARRGAMHPGHCAGRQPACLSTEQERMLRTLAQHQLASNQALSPLHSRPRAPAAVLLNTEAQEPPLVVAALCSAACEQRSARPTPGTPRRT